MKTKLIVILLSVGLAFLIACDGSDENKENLITEKIQYDVLIKSPNPDYDWWINNLPGPQRDKVVDWIFEKALSGELKAIDYFNKPLTPEDIKKIGVDTIYQTLLRDYPPFEEYDTLIVTHLEINDITKVRFLEQWYWDDDGDEIEKEVIAIAPVIEKRDGDGKFIANHPLFWLYFEEED